jgi:hypothetical protein
MAEALSKLLETFVDPFCVRTYSAIGYWAHNHQDVQRWTGQVEVNGILYSIGSWALTIRDLNRGRPFVVDDQRGKLYADNHFQFEPLND